MSSPPFTQPCPLCDGAQGWADKNSLKLRRRCRLVWEKGHPHSVLIVKKPGDMAASHKLKEIASWWVVCVWGGGGTLGVGGCVGVGWEGGGGVGGSHLAALQVGGGNGGQLPGGPASRRVGAWLLGQGVRVGAGGKRRPNNNRRPRGRE